MTRAGSPQLLAVPQLSDNVDEDLDQVRQTLLNIGHTRLFRVREDPEGAVGAYYSSVQATPFAFRATQKEVCLYAERLPSFLMLR